MIFLNLSFLLGKIGLIIPIVMRLRCHNGTGRSEHRAPGAHGELPTALLSSSFSSSQDLRNFIPSTKKPWAKPSSHSLLSSSTLPSVIVIAPSWEGHRHHTPSSRLPRRLGWSPLREVDFNRVSRTGREHCQGWAVSDREKVNLYPGHPRGLPGSVVGRHTMSHVKDDRSFAPPLYR